MREAERADWGTSAPLAGPASARRLLLPTEQPRRLEDNAPAGGAWRSFEWPVERSQSASRRPPPPGKGPPPPRPPRGSDDSDNDNDGDGQGGGAGDPDAGTMQASSSASASETRPPASTGGRGRGGGRGGGSGSGGRGKGSEGTARPARRRRLGICSNDTGTSGLATPNDDGGGGSSTRWPNPRVRSQEDQARRGGAREQDALPSRPKPTTSADREAPGASDPIQLARARTNSRPCTAKRTGIGRLRRLQQASQRARPGGELMAPTTSRTLHRATNSREAEDCRQVSEPASRTLPKNQPATRRLRRGDAREGRNQRQVTHPARLDMGHTSREYYSFPPAKI